eukprot:scaffold1161_cov391-Prasinococcus_capsulatus_cf.AAC.8
MVWRRLQHARYIQPWTSEFCGASEALGPHLPRHRLRLVLPKPCTILTHAVPFLDLQASACRVEQPNSCGAEPLRAHSQWAPHSGAKL